MPATEQITISLRDLKTIIYMLKELHWASGPVIIKDTGKKIYVRDKDEQHLFHIDKEKSG